MPPPLPPTHPAPQQTDALPLVWPYHNAPHESYILLLRRAYVVVITYKLHASHTSLRVLNVWVANVHNPHSACRPPPTIYTCVQPCRENARLASAITSQMLHPISARIRGSIYPFPNITAVARHHPQPPNPWMPVPWHDFHLSPSPSAFRPLPPSCPHPPHPHPLPPRRDPAPHPSQPSRHSSPVALRAPSSSSSHHQPPPPPPSRPPPPASFGSPHPTTPETPAPAESPAASAWPPPP